MEKDEILNAGRLEVQRLIADLECEIDNINIQLEQDKSCPSPDNWRHRAKLAQKHMIRDLNLARTRLKIIGSNEHEKARIKIPKKGRLELEKSMNLAIIEEIRLLIEPAEYLRCIERAKHKVSYSEELQRLKNIA